MAVRARDVLGPHSPLARVLPGYEAREVQLAMADAVEHAMLHDTPLFVEAGTGTGKTLAYLVPAILSGKKVVVSTATKALQEQIFLKDVPLVAQALGALGIAVDAAMMKGLSNYLCKRRLAEARASGTGSMLLGRIAEWARETETGDRAELTDLAEDAPAWQSAQSSSDTRIGAGCAFFDECFVTKMKANAERARLVVVNHHLFLADLALRTTREGYASVIPNYDAVVFDEAHQLEDIATDFFGVRVSSGRVNALVRDAERTLLAEGKLELMKAGGARSMIELVDEASRALFAALGARRRGEPGSRAVLTSADWSGEVLDACGALDTRLHALEAWAHEERKREPIAVLERRARDLRADLRSIVEGSRGSFPTTDPDGLVHDDEAKVAWIDVRERSVSIGASPIDLAPTLKKKLFERVPTVICTSATLATGKSCKFFKSRLGAPHDAPELVVDSPFDFARRAALYVPRDLPEPSSPHFDVAAAERVAELVAMTDGGAFVLCTSNRSMRALHAALASRVRQTLLLQGDAPKHLLLSRFRASGHAVLVATMSFWEGVDVPGRALRLVVLDKIPFAVPSDPVVAARCARLDREGGNSFAQYSVPCAAITLKQGFGRLVRTQADGGVVALLDRRAITKGYGRALLGALPPARRIASVEDVRAFWDEIAPTLT